MITPPLTITLSGHSFRIVAGRQSFWQSYAASQWEPDTLAILDHYVGPDTLYLDIGAWIGPTLLYAAGLTKHAVGFEPDPAAFDQLRQNLAANPDLSHAQIHPCAIASRKGSLRMGSISTPGDSMSSALFADQNRSSWNAPAFRLEDLESSWPDSSAPCFVKIDIEGGEFSELPGLAPFLIRRRATILLSLHKAIFMRPHENGGRFGRLLGEFYLFLRILSFYPLLRRYPYIYDQHHRRLSSLDVLRRRHWRQLDTLLLSHSPGPWIA